MDTAGSAALPEAEPALAEELREQNRELDELCSTLDERQWRQPTAFYTWSAWDEVAHLCFFDQAAVWSLTEPGRFAEHARDVNERVAGGESVSSLHRKAYGALDAPALHATWRAGYRALSQALAGRDPRDRVDWYGHLMSVRSFGTARLMESWAHAQDVWDLLGRRRPRTARLRHIAHLGFNTFGWSFVNRGLAVPAHAPCVTLQAPDGRTWSWGDPESPTWVHGDAEDFCLVVTQRRHVDDTQLRCSPGAREWLRIAQCFAGDPASGPGPGERVSVPLG